MSALKITLIGSGNVATNLGLALFDGGYTSLKICSRKFENANELASKINANVLTEISEIPSTEELIILCCNDDALNDLRNKIPHLHIPVVHTSGINDISIFKACKFKHYGVFYPLQSLSKQNPIRFTKVPICLEYNDEYTEKVLKTMANSVSELTYEISSDQRKVLHLAAVFTNNFSNHLFSIAEDILTANGMSFELLKPLMVHTVEKARLHSPKTQQTGPAQRGDKLTMDKHLALLSDENHKDLYRIMSKLIIDQKNNKVD